MVVQDELPFASALELGVERLDVRENRGVVGSGNENGGPGTASNLVATQRAVSASSNSVAVTARPVLGHSQVVPDEARTKKVKGCVFICLPCVRTVFHRVGRGDGPDDERPA